jgi:hypothetical protein
MSFKTLLEAKLTASKARKILRDGEVHGRKLTKKQKRFFGAIAGGQEPYEESVDSTISSTNFGRTLESVLEATKTQKGVIRGSIHDHLYPSKTQATDPRCNHCGWRPEVDFITPENHLEIGLQIGAHLAKHHPSLLNVTHGHIDWSRRRK